MASEFTIVVTTASYMAKVCGLANSLCGVTIDSFVALLALSRLDPDLSPGIRASFLQADPSLLSRNLRGIEARMEKEDHLKKLLPTSDQVRHAATSHHPSQSPTSPTDYDQKVLSDTNKSRMQLKLVTASGAGTPTIHCV